LTKNAGGNAALKILCMMVLTLLMLVNIAGAAPFAYITNIGNNTTSVIDIANNTVTATVPVGSLWGVAVSPDGQKAYVANLF
jgi:YVTN family beta-propeller protein